jgi:site-specific recombinase XerD
MKNGSFAVLIWANKAKADIKGWMPLYARVTVEGRRAEISLKKKVNPAKWDAQAGVMKGASEESRLVNNHLTDVRNELWNIYTEKNKLDQYISAEEIKDKFLGTETEHRSLLEVFDEHNEQLRELVGKDYVKATLTKYTTIRSKVAAFILYKYQRPDLLLAHLEFGFITGFEHYLKTVENIDHNTTMAYIKRVKRIITISINNNWLQHNPFAAFKCTTRKVVREELTLAEIALLAEKKFAVARLEEVRDCFLFSCYTGYAFVDAFLLTPANLVVGTDGGLWINTSRKKTDIVANVPLLPEAIAIVRKYENHPERIVKNKLLPLKSNQKMNAYLKEIADLCGITKHLTTHIARHTFASTVTLENDVPIESVSKMLGHTKITTTQLYARVREKKVGRDMKLLGEKMAGR